MYTTLNKWQKINKSLLFQSCLVYYIFLVYNYKRFVGVYGQLIIILSEIVLIFFNSNNNHLKIFKYEY